LATEGYGTCTDYQCKRLRRVTLVPQYGKAVERFVNIRMKNAFV